MSEAIETQAVEVVEQDEDQALAAGFAEARGEEPPVIEPVVVEEAAPAAETPPQEEPPEEPQVVFAGLTEDQLRSVILKANEVDSLKEQIQKAFGKHGEVMREIGNLKARGSGVKVNREKFARLNEEFPEVAEMLFEGLESGIEAAGGASQQVDVSQIEARVRDELVRANETRLLQFAHRDWNDVVKSDEFSLWRKNVLNAEDNKQLDESWDAIFIADKLSEFKAWRDKSAKTQESKQKRLEAAVLPRGEATRPSTIQTEEEAMLAAFRAARGG